MVVKYKNKAKELDLFKIANGPSMLDAFVQEEKDDQPVYQFKNPDIREKRVWSRERNAQMSQSVSVNKVAVLQFHQIMDD